MVESLAIKNLMSEDVKKKKNGNKKFMHSGLLCRQKGVNTPGNEVFLS